MAVASSVPPTSATYLRTAKIVGAASSFATLALSIVSAAAIVELTKSRFAPGLALLMGVLATRWLLSTALGEWSDSATRRLRASWRHSLIEHLVRPRREGERGRGDLALAIERASNAPSLERLRASAAASLVGVGAVFWFAGWVAFIITLALLALAAPLYRRAGQRSEALATKYQARRALLEARQLEVLQHAPELRALGAVNYGAHEIGAISESEHVLALRAIRVALESSLVTEFLSGVSIGLVAMVVGFALLGGRISLFHALAAVLVTSELFIQVRRYGTEFHRRDEAQHALDALDVPTSTDSTPRDDALLCASDLVTSANSTPVTLEVRRGDRVIITGLSGVGKTVLLHTLLGWRPALGGSLTRTSQGVGYVSVESSLTSGSLRDNLTLGVGIDDDAVLGQLRAVGLDDTRFQDLDLALLADGRGISSGERVRLVLVRALLARPLLVVLDDVAGVLDAEARATLRRALDDAPELAIVEATVDTPLLTSPSQRVEIRS